MKRPPINVFTEVEIAKKLRDPTRSYDDIMQEYDISYSTLRRIMVKQEVPNRPRGRPPALQSDQQQQREFTPEEVTNIRKQFKEGQKITDIWRNGYQHKTYMAVWNVAHNRLHRQKF